MAKLKLGILISGRGSNLAALITACEQINFPAEIVLVLSNRENAQGLNRAKTANIPTQVITHAEFSDRKAFDSALTEALEHAGVELICLAGFMRLLGNDFVARWTDKIINIHPSLLPAFRGLHVHERAIKAGVRLSGCTVHYVRSEVDDGPIIIQAAVPVLTDDDEVRLAARILQSEHQIYPEAVRLIATGQAHPHGDIVKLTACDSAEATLINPSIKGK